MPIVTGKNIPLDLYDLLKQLAEANRRSTNSKIIVCIEKAVASRPIDPEDVLATAGKLRELTDHYIATHEELNQAKNADRY
jgi:hypothetical protein